MNTTVAYRGRTYKTVVVSGITFDDSRDDILDAALRTAGETRGSLFGWNIGHAWLGDDNRSRCTVDLYTD